jgi:hypothetical protein
MPGSIRLTAADLCRPVGFDDAAFRAGRAVTLLAAGLTVGLVTPPQTTGDLGGRPGPVGWSECSTVVPDRVIDGDPGGLGSSRVASKCTTIQRTVRHDRAH